MQQTEYLVHYGEDRDTADVVHVTLKEARYLIARKPSDLLLVEKVVRYYDRDGRPDDYTTLWER
jgi:hypothetical protein